VAWDRNLEMLYVVGVKTGSIPRWERRRRGVEWLMVGVMRLWRIVGVIKLEGQRYEGRFLRL